MSISAIIPTYNSKHYLKKTLNSIFIQNFNHIEVIVIDNGSSDNTYEFVKNQFPSVKIIRNNKNMGACFARNQGMEIAKGDYVIFMDCDVELENNFFSNLGSILKNLPQNIAGVSPKIIDKNSKRIFSCGLYISPIYRVYDIERDKSPHISLQHFNIDGPNSCCAIFRRECLEDIKGRNYFDEDFFFLFEDADLAWRLKDKGYRCLFMPQLICFHYGNSSNVSKQRRRYFCFRNRFYMILKNDSQKNLLSFFLRSFPYDVLRTLHFFLTNKHSFLIFGDLIRKYKNEKNHHF